MNRETRIRRALSKTDTHVLVDAQGVAVMSGSYDEMMALAVEVMAEGATEIAVRPIDEAQTWE
jgi:hypothetical protein